MKYLLSVVILGINMLGHETRQKRHPSFEDFRVARIHSRKPAAARIISRRAKLYRTMISEGAKDGPNFAGRYTIVSWGCGSDCHQYAIVDAITGQVFSPPELVQIDSCCFYGKDPLAEEETIQFRKDSRLLITVGLRYVGRRDEQMGKFYYEWRNNKLRLLASIRGRI